jgi:hypothetical protein
VTESPLSEFQPWVPVGAWWLDLPEPWWRIFRREALGGQIFADAREVGQATVQATAALNARARLWMGPSAPKPRVLQRQFLYDHRGTQHPDAVRGRGCAP